MTDPDHDANARLAYVLATLRPFADVCLGYHAEQLAQRGATSLITQAQWQAALDVYEHYTRDDA